MRVLHGTLVTRAPRRSRRGRVGANNTHWRNWSQPASAGWPVNFERFTNPASGPKCPLKTLPSRPSVWFPLLAQIGRLTKLARFSKADFASGELYDRVRLASGEMSSAGGR